MIQKSIGRTLKNDISFPNDNMVSREHALIYFDEGSILIEDLDSANGTFVNGNRIFSIIKLEEYDILKVGDSLVNWNNVFIEVENNLDGNGDLNSVNPTDEKENDSSSSQEIDDQEYLKTMVEFKQKRKFKLIKVIVIVIIASSVIAGFIYF